MKIELRRVDDAFHFEAVGPSEIPVHIDAAGGVGGREEGARPMELVAMGLAGCAVIDFILILQKQRQELEDIRITIDAERYKNQTPSPFEKIHLFFYLKGNLDAKKVSKALSLSIDKYCSVAEMVRSTAAITYDFEIESE